MIVTPALSTVHALAALYTHNQKFQIDANEEEEEEDEKKKSESFPSWVFLSMPYVRRSSSTAAVEEILFLGGRPYWRPSPWEKAF